MASGQRRRSALSSPTKSGAADSAGGRPGVMTPAWSPDGVNSAGIARWIGTGVTSTGGATWYQAFCGVGVLIMIVVVRVMASELSSIGYDPSPLFHSDTLG